MSLSESQIKNAIKLVDNGLVQELDDEHWLVQGSKGDYYHIDKTELDGKIVFTCWKNPSEKKLCQGWKFCQGSEKECKHTEAVAEFLRRQN